ncbi:MAG TPA: DUF4350 domain-containing protein, partial [Steroidobacteraceae bacterium]|nr:DUF4350 domain-containing protein [Steroidobacteraceae bacterium]
LAAGALALFYTLFFPKPAATPQTIVLPLSSESGPDGYLAVWRWLGERHVPEVSLRYRYDRLPEFLKRATGNLLIVNLPQQVPARSAELADLTSWVKQGNTLLLMTALEDTPLWALNYDPLLAERLERMTGLRFSSLEVRKQDLKSITIDRLVLAPRGAHPLLAGVRQVTAISPLPTRRWAAMPQNGLEPLELAAREDDRDPVLWLRREGAGQILIMSVGSAFSNAAVELTDNAQLLSNIVGWSLGPGGAVIFDDAHQGQTAFYDGKAFFADPRLHATLGWIVILWLAFVVGQVPLRALRHAWQPLDETAYVEASARYFAAVVPQSDLAQRLIEEFLAGLRSRLKLGDRASLWEWLEAQASISEAQRRTLQTCYTSACAGRRVDLVKLQNLLAEFKRKLQ